MKLLVKEPPRGSSIYEASDASEPGEVLGRGASPDEAIGSAVRWLILSGGPVIVRDIETVEDVPPQPSEED